MLKRAWTSGNSGKAAEALEECAEVIQSGEMPMKSYVRMYPEARFTQKQRDALIAWFNASSGQTENGKEAGKVKNQNASSSHEEYGEEQEED